MGRVFECETHPLVLAESGFAATDAEMASEYILYTWYNNIVTAQSQYRSSDAFMNTEHQNATISLNPSTCATSAEFRHERGVQDVPGAYARKSQPVG
jgi:hypothetical protein